jgi:exopolysaccharide biosynthesis polyprenyl glycosylphosphotransferase
MIDRRRLLLATFQCSDLLILALSFAIAITAVHAGVTQDVLTTIVSMRVKVVNVVIFGVFLLVSHFLFRAQGLYRSRRMLGSHGEAGSVLTASSMAAVTLAILGATFDISLVTARFLLAFWTATVVLALASRLVMRAVLGYLRRRGRNLRFVLIVGTNPRAIEIAVSITSRPELGYRLIGFADSPWDGLATFRRSGHLLVADLSGLEGFLRETVIDEVIVALPVRSCYETIRHVLMICRQQGILVRLGGNTFDLITDRSTAEALGGLTLVSVNSQHGHAANLLFKRATDLALSALLLIACSPVFLATAALIGVTSGRPIFFVQERMGINKRRFRLYKFRTMVRDAEQRQEDLDHLNEATGPVFKLRADPRVTRVGAYLRKASIDELPQLWNVLKGDMSLVGPRPLPVRDVKGFTQDWHRQRFSVRPGITCLWQVSGRSNLPFAAWMELDKKYVDHWSIWLDLKILIKTIPAVLKREGAA